MKIVFRMLALMVLIAFVGCTTAGGGGAPAAGDGDGSKLSDADLQRIGIKETYEKR